MCGITGAVWWSPEKEVSRGTLQQMTDSIAHRGPDAEGFLLTGDGTGSNPGVALGHRRLSIIDVGGSAQPLGNEDGSVQIVFNGEIFNYRDLRAQLISAGHQFRTNGDTETIVHLYEEYGAECVNYLRGMFAFALWDENRKTLLLARDRLGQKPLFYSDEPDRIVFGSELKSLLQVPGTERRLNSDALLQFLTLQYVPAPHSVLKGFRRLPPAHLAVIRDGTCTVKQYWQPPYNQPDQNRTRIEDWREELKETLSEAVRLRLRSDVPLGAFLSGGVDSTIITGLMQTQLKDPVRTFSIGFPVAEYDERSFARAASEKLGTSHTESVVHPDALAILPELVWHYDEPFGDSSAVPTMYLSRMTREHVTVALTGDAGDELFCGYDRYRAVRIAGRLDRIPRFLRSAMAKAAALIPGSFRQRSFRRRLKRLLQTLSESPERRYLNWVSIFNRDKLQDLVSADLWAEAEKNDPAGHIFDAYRLCPNRDFLTRTTAADVVSYLPGDLLTKVDIASMSCGLECRSPFLDHHVVELAARMPIDVKYRNGIGKLILKDAFQDLMPDEIVRRPKMGFGVPISHWFRHQLKPLLYDVLLSEKATQRGLLRTGVVQQMVEQHINGVFDHGYRLWNLLVLELWFRTYLDAPPPVTAPGTIL